MSEARMGMFSRLLTRYRVRTALIELIESLDQADPEQIVLREQRRNARKALGFPQPASSIELQVSHGKSYPLDAPCKAD